MQPLPAPAKFEPGDEVVVPDGPFRWAREVVREVRGTHQLIIWVSAIGRGVAFNTGAALVVRVF